MSTGIEWTDETWNPTTGCNQVSPGCAHCYAKTLTERWGRVFEDVKLHEDRLRKPLGWKTPRRVFVNSMSDLFHEDIPDEFIDKVFAVMALTPQHQYQVLTKRPERMREYLTAGRTLHIDGRLVPKDYTSADFVLWAAQGITESTPDYRWEYPTSDSFDWPLPNVWLGVSVENQHWADVRIPVLLDTPAAVRFISAEPLLGPVSLESLPHPSGAHLNALYGCTWVEGSMPDITGPSERLDWVIVGGESGAKRRSFDLGWASYLQAQCAKHHVPLFFKQTGAFKPGQPSGDPELDAAKAWPEVSQ